MTLAGPIRERVRGLDPEVPVYWVQTMEESLSETLITRRVPLMLLAIFAGIALFLSFVGVYGVLANSLSQRTRELGIRIALGSSRGRVCRLMLGEGMGVVLPGLGLGALGSYLLVLFSDSFGPGLLDHFLFKIDPTDPVVFGFVGTLLGAMGIIACLVPTLRAVRVDPVAALHSD